LRVYEVHHQNKEYLQNNNFIAFKYEETSFRRQEKKSLSKALKLQMQESDGSTDDEMTLIMSKKCKQMIKKKGKFQHSSRKKYSRLKKKNQDESNEVIYFKCRKPVTMKIECPYLK